MSGGRRHRAFVRQAVVLVAVTLLVLLGLNALAWRLNPSVDLTTNHRHSVSPGTTRAIDGLAWPITATFHISRERPPSTASLKRDITAKLVAIASGSSGNFQFNAATSVVDVAGTSVAEGELAKIGVRPTTVTTPSGTVRYFASVRLESVGLREPVVIPAESPERLEYEIATQVLRARHGRSEPPSNEAKFAALGEGLSITYVCGTKVLGFGDDGKLPKAWEHLPVEAEKIFARIKAANPSIVTVIDHDPTSPNRTGQPINGTVYSHFQLIHGGRRATRIDSVTSMDGMFGLLARTAWELTLPRRKIGVFFAGDSSALRHELTLPESRRIYLNWSPEARLMELLEQLGHEPIEVRATHESGIPTEIAALILPRPSGLSPIELYELRAYLAAGGKALVFHGEWHVPLLDAGLTLNQQAQVVGEMFMAGEPTGLIELRRVEGTLSGYLASLGVDTSAGILVGAEDAMAARVLGPSRKTGVFHTAEPSVYAARAGLVPVAANLESPHVLVRDVMSLPLRGASPLQVDAGRLATAGLQVEVMLAAPRGSVVLPLDASRDKAKLQYAAASGEPLAEWIPAVLNGGVASPVGIPADGLPVALSVRGQFPFDANEMPPPPPGGGKVTLRAPGERFIPSPGQLVVVSSPNVLEHLDGSGAEIVGLPNAGPLVGDSFRAGEGALRRLLANVVDSFVYGDELIEVRQSLLPTPRRVLPWSESERALWLGLNLGLVPVLALLGWLGLAVWRRRA